MSKAIALAVGMTGLFFPHNHRAGDHGIRAEITHVWSESCINISSTEGVDFEVTSVYVPPMGTPIVAFCSGNYFLPDAFLEAAKVASREQTEEQAIVQAGADKAPRVTPDDIEAQIQHEFYFTAAEGVAGSNEFGTKPAAWTNMDQITICVLILRNGVKVVGVNEGPVSRENFSADIGRQYARQKAIDQIWPMLGYELRSKLAGLD